MALLINSGQIEVGAKHQYNYHNPINKDIRVIFLSILQFIDIWILSKKKTVLFS